MNFIISLAAIFWAQISYADQVARTCFVDDYGAKGDGVTNDRVAIQSAIADCINLSGRPAIAPNRVTFRVNATYRIHRESNYQTGSQSFQGRRKFYVEPGIFIVGSDLTIEGNGARIVASNFNNAIGGACNDASCVYALNPSPLYVYPVQIMESSISQGGSSPSDWSCRHSNDLVNCQINWKGAYRPSQNISIRQLTIEETDSLHTASNCMGVIGVDNVIIQQVKCLKARQTSFAFVAKDFPEGFTAAVKNVQLLNSTSDLSGRHAIRASTEGRANVQLKIDGVRVSRVLGPEVGKWVLVGSKETGALKYVPHVAEGHKVALFVWAQSPKLNGSNAGVTVVNSVFDSTGEVFTAKHFKVDIDSSQIHGGGVFKNLIGAQSTFSMTRNLVNCQYRPKDASASLVFSGFNSGQLGPSNRYYRHSNLNPCYSTSNLNENKILLVP